MIRLSIKPSLTVGDYDVAFCLAVEEWAARCLPPQDYFFMWQVGSSVIFGRNQILENEVNIPYCRQHGIRIFRRKSGGGCVYADKSNVMLSYITPEDNVTETFHRYLSMVSRVLQSLGLDAYPSGHNDIMLRSGGVDCDVGLPKKVSGNAIYHIPGRIIAHGTLLYDTDMENMLNAITPSKTKLSKHGVSSVRQRICLLKDYTKLPLDDIKRKIYDSLCDDNRFIDEDDLQRIRKIQHDYLSEQWIREGR